MRRLNCALFQIVCRSAWCRRCEKSGVATTNQFDDASLERCVRAAETLAKLAPENDEYMPELGPQVYKSVPTFAQPTADISPEYRAQVAAEARFRDDKVGQSEREGVGHD